MVATIPPLRWIRKRVFGIAIEEVTCARRGFRGSDAGVRRRLEHIGFTFVQGYHAALDDDALEVLISKLNAVADELRGFAFEGAAMGLTLLDTLTPWKRGRLQAFLQGPGTPYTYIMHTGVGWGLALLHRRVEPPLARLDPLLRWLAVDGYGFYHGYFHWPRSILGHVFPAHLTGYACHAFDQGLGRSLWFVDGADVTRIPITIATFPPSRHADLWSGVGLACAYAGIVDRLALETLRAAAGPYRPHLAQGAAFAAKARQRAGNPADHTELVCIVLCGLSATAAAAITDVALQDLPSDGPRPAYEVWRQRLQAHFAREVATL